VLLIAGSTLIIGATFSAVLWLALTGTLAIALGATADLGATYGADHRHHRGPAVDALLRPRDLVRARRRRTPASWAATLQAYPTALARYRRRRATERAT
jgi:hypothetical protein